MPMNIREIEELESLIEDLESAIVHLNKALYSLPDDEFAKLQDMISANIEHAKIELNEEKDKEYENNKLYEQAARSFL